MLVACTCYNVIDRKFIRTFNIFMHNNSLHPDAFKLKVSVIQNLNESLTSWMELKLQVIIEIASNNWTNLILAR